MTDAARRPWAFSAALALVLAALLAAYSNTFQNAFHFDDSHVVENNLYIRNIANLPHFFRDASTFSSLPANATYRPLVTASLAVDYWIGGGLTPRPFHVSQLLLLLLLFFMLLVLFRRLLDDAEPRWWNAYVALIAAAVFALHTTATETMNLMHARSELMSVTGVVGAFLVYRCLPATRRFGLYLLPMFVGALAKSQAAVFGPLFVAYVFLFEQQLALADLFRSRSRARVLAAIKTALPAVVVSTLVLLWVESKNASASTYGGGTPIEYLRTQCWVWLHYGRLFVFPVGLTADTDWNVIASWFDTRVIVGLTFVVVLLRLLWVSSARAALRPAAFGLAWFLIALLPASSLIPLAEVVNEHRVFFPYVGLSLAAISGTAWLLEERARTSPRLAPWLTQGAAAAALVVLSGNAVGTYERNKAWRTEETLWKDVTEKSPENGRGWMNYGLTQMAQGRYQDARAMFERAEIYTPNYASLEVNLGIVTDRLGEPAVAEPHFARALKLQPGVPSSYSFYARWLLEQGRVSEAIPLLVQAVALSPAEADARSWLMDAYARTGRTAELKALALQTLTLVPGDQDARRFVNERGDLVAERLAEAAARRPLDLLNASLGRYRAGDFQGSIDLAREALALKQNYPEAWNNIAAAFSAMRRWEEAIRAAREALRLKPDFPLARNNLAWAEGESRKARQGGG